MKNKKVQKEERTVLENIEYLNSLTPEKKNEIYKKMLGISKYSNKNIQIPIQI